MGYSVNLIEMFRQYREKTLMHLWKQEKRANAQELIDWLLSMRTETGAWRNEWITTVAFAELGYSSSQPSLSKMRIMQVLNEMSKTDQKTVEDFEVTLARIRKTGAISDNEKINDWHFFIPIKVTLNPDINQRLRIRILNRIFSFVRLSSVKRQLDHQSKVALSDPRVIRRNVGVEIERTPDVFLSVSSQGSNPYSAWDKVAPAFDVLRGIIELTLGIYKGRMMWGGQSARRKIPHPLWMIAYKKETKLEWITFLTEDDKTARLFDLTNERLTRIKENARTLTRESNPKSTMSLIADCLRLYSQAMDASFNYLSFLGFWQLAEAITRSEGYGGKTDKVVSRIAWHGAKFGLKGSGYRDTLLALGNKRNDIVHRGIHNVEDNDINILKAACEIALDWLFVIRKSLPTTAHIEQYYSLREKSDTDYRAIRDSLAYVKKHRGK